MSLITFFLPIFAPGAALFIVCAVALYIIWPHVRPYITGHDPFATRFLHATRGKPAWALVTDAAAPVSQQLCFELAGKGFNIVLYGREQQRREKDPATGKKLADLRTELARRFPENRYRIALALAEDAGAEDRFAGLVAASLKDVNLTVVVNTLREGDAGLPPRLLAALMPLLGRNKPALVLNVLYSPTIRSKEPCLSCEANKAADGVDVVAYCLGEGAGGVSRTSFLRPTPRGMAKAVLAHAGCRGGADGGRGKGAGDVVYPYWPHGAMQGLRQVLPKQAVDGILALIEGV